MKDKSFQLIYILYVFLLFTLPPYILYTYAYDRAVFDTLKKIECLRGAKDGTGTNS